MDERKFKRVEPADPTRCQSIGMDGNQCPFQGEPEGETFLNRCFMHMGPAHAATVKRKALKLYHVEKYRQRLDRLSDPEVGAFLDEELATLRMTLETCLNKYEELELITQSGQISSLVDGIRNTLVANTKLKSQLGALLDRGTLNKLCDALVGIVSKHVPAAKMDSVSEEVAQAVATAVANRGEA